MTITVGTKIAAGFGLALAMLILISAVSYYNTTVLTETARLVSHSRQVREETQGLLASLTDAETGQRGFLLTGEDPYLAPYQSALTEIDRRTKTLRSLTADNATQQRSLDRLDPLVSSKLAELQETIDARRQPGGFDAAVQIVVGDRGKQVMDNIRGVLAEMQTEEDNLLKARSDAADASARTTMLTIVLGTIIAFVIVGLAGFVITRNIAAPLGELTSVAEQIAGGSLDGTISADGRTDEVGVLVRSFQRMQDSLSSMATAAERIAARDLRAEVTPQSADDALGKSFAKMIENLREQNRQAAEAATVLAGAANEIVAAATQVSSSAAETASAVSQTTTTVEEVKQTAQLVSEKARGLSETAQRAARISQDGLKAADAAVEGMNNIHLRMDALGQNMVRLSEQNQSISDIVMSVNALAERSHLLAVNASIEAAKAGEAGRGFGVVASEVKALADQSKQATDQIRVILGDIQKAMSSAVLATEQGSRAVEVGLKQATESGEAIQLLSESVSETTQAALQIAASSHQQLIGMDQVALAMENINEASAQNAASTRQTELAAQNLHELGQRLTSIVEQYST